MVSDALSRRERLNGLLTVGCRGESEKAFGLLGLATATHGIKINKRTQLSEGQRFALTFRELGSDIMYILGVYLDKA